MNGLLKQSQTATNIVFYLVLASDHYTPATGLVPVVTLSKNGGNFAAASGAVTEIASGWYSLAGNATDSGTLGPLIVKASVATADDVHDLWQIVAYDPRDSVRAGLTALPNAAAAASGGLLINGSNTGTVTLAALTITGTTTHTGATVHTGNVSMAAGLTITQSSANSNAITATGNGSGTGFKVIGGTTGHGFYAKGGDTSGQGMLAQGTGIGAGFSARGGGTSGAGMEAIATNDGNGFTILGGTNGSGLFCEPGLSGGYGFDADSLRVVDTTTLTGAVSFGSTFGITGAATVNNAGNAITVDTVKISGDATAADALETMLDGSGGNTLSLGALTVTGNASIGAGLTITQSTVDGHGVVVTGNGDGKGMLIQSGSGILNEAVRLSSANGNALVLSATNGSGLVANVGSYGIFLSGSTSIRCTAAVQLATTLTVSGATTFTGAVTATNASNAITGIDVTKWLGTTVATPATAGIPDVNSKNWNNLATVALPLVPTTAGRTLDVSTGGEAGVDWANVGTPSSTVNLSNTTVNLVNTVTTVTNMPNIGNGAYSVQSTTTDGTNPLQGALVRVTSGLDSFSNLTDASGHASFSLNAGTYTVSVAKTGYTFTPTTRTVTGNNAGTLYSSVLAMTAVLIPATPTDPTYTRIFGYMRELRTGNMLKGVRVIARRIPSAGKAYAGGFLIGDEISAVTDSTGLVLLDVPKSNQIDPTAQWQIICKEAGISTTQTLTTDLFDLATLMD